MLITATKMMMSTSIALAAPPTDILQRVETSFVPGAKALVKREGYSFSLCPMKSLRLEILDAVTRRPAVVEAKIYLPRRRQAKSELRSVIILPPTGGENMLDRGYANALCAAGFQSVLVSGWTHQTDSKLELSVHDEGALRALSAVRHVLDYLNPTRNTQVGILGTSVGALSASLALGFDARLQSSVLIVGGVDLPQIYAHSDERGAVKLREQRMRALGFGTRKNYLAALRQHVRIEPRDFAGHSGPKNVLAFIGSDDTTVPTRNQEELAAVFRAERAVYSGNHFQTILHTYWRERPRITRFFQRNLR
jgi:hypothetical protein